MTEQTPDHGFWRSPQLVRDRKPFRPGFAERVVKVERDLAIPLLLYKAHNELYEIGEEPTDVSEHGDFLTVLRSLSTVVRQHWEGPFRGDDAFEHTLARAIADAARPADPISSVDIHLGRMHRAIEAYARDLRAWVLFVGLVAQQVALLNHLGIGPGAVIEAMDEKGARLGTFDDHTLWISTEY